LQAATNAINSEMDRLESVEGICSFACDCAWIGTFRKALKKIGFLPSGCQPPFSGISFISLQNGIRDRRKAMFCCVRNEETSTTAASNSQIQAPVGKLSGHECKNADRMNIKIETIAQIIRGFGFEDIE